MFRKIMIATMFIAIAAGYCDERKQDIINSGNKDEKDKGYLDRYGNEWETIK